MLLLSVISYQKSLNKFPETMWYKMSKMYSLIILEISSPNQDVGQDHASSKDSEGESLLDSSRVWWFLDPWFSSNLFLHLYMAFFPV